MRQRREFHGGRVGQQQRKPRQLPLGGPTSIAYPAGSAQNPGSVKRDCRRRHAALPVGRPSEVIIAYGRAVQ
jgi:hypothetical protein